MNKADVSTFEGFDGFFLEGTLLTNLSFLPGDNRTAA